MMRYLKNHPSNIFNRLGILIGIPIAILGASNPLLLVLGIGGSIAATIALISGMKESTISERESQQKEQAIQQWKENMQLRIDFESAANAPGIDQETRWELFDKQHPNFRSNWSLQPGEVRMPIIGQAPAPKRKEE